MQLPRLFATGLWLSATGVSTFMVWTATSIVAADVTDRPAPVIGRDDVVSELESGSSTVQAAPTTAVKALGSTSTVPVQVRGPVPGSPSAAVPPGLPSPPPQPVVTIPRFSPPATAAAPGAPPTTRPASPTTTAPPRPTATYSTSGGVARVACNGFYFIELLSAVPSNGYSVEVKARGPGNVDVHFVRSGEDVSVKAVCFGQPIRYYDQSPPPRQAP